MRIWQTVEAFARGFGDCIDKGWAMPASTANERAYMAGYSLAHFITGGI